MQIEKREDGGNRITVGDHLQKEFSLNYTLSLYLAQTIELLDPGPEHDLNMLTLVESILEDPRAVLFRQIDKAKVYSVNRKKHVNKIHCNNDLFSEIRNI